MLSDVVRKSLDRIHNRFELVVVTAERCRMLLAGARQAVDNPAREKVTKLALREIVEGRLLRETADGWKVDRPALPDIFLPETPSREDAEDILGLRDREENGEDEEDEEE